MALLYGPPAGFPGGFAGWMRARLEAGQEVPLYTDQFRTLVYVGDVARSLRLLIEKQPAHGLYHLGGAERLSRWEFGQKYVEVFGYDPRLLRPTVSRAVGGMARGLDCSLDSGRFAGEFGFRPAGALQGLRRMKEAVY